jgi:hypothetical protein
MIDYEAGLGPLPNAREYYMERATQNMLGHIDSSGKYYEDKNSPALRAEVTKFGEMAKQAEWFPSKFQAAKQVLPDLTEDDYVEWLWTQGTYRGYTPADPIGSGSAPSNIPVRDAPPREPYRTSPL